MKTSSKTETLKEFGERNISKWCFTGTKFNQGNVNILQYAYYTKIRAEQDKNVRHSKSITQWFVGFMQKNLFYQPFKMNPFQTKMF